MGDISNAYVTGFNRNVYKTVEAKGGKIRPFVSVESGDTYHEDGVYQRTTGGGRPQKRTNRNADSPVSELDYSRRRVRRYDVDDGQYLDWSDIERIVVNLQDPKLYHMTQKFRREEDIMLQQAALGVAKGGDNGETDVAFGNGLTDNNIIDVTLGAEAGVTNAGFTYEKLQAVMDTFGSNNVDIEYEMPTVFMSYTQHFVDMMGQDKFINQDYINRSIVDVGNGVKYLPNYLGANFIFSTIVPFMNTAGTGFRIADTDNTTGSWADTDTTDIRACFAFCKSGLMLEISPDIKSRITERSDKGFNWYAYIKMGLGAVRMEEEKVIAIPCDQSPA